jgi:hypothetical protein
MSAGSSNGASASSGYGYSSSLANSATNVWGAQAAPLQSLYGQAQGQAGQGVDPSISGAAAGGVGALSKIAGGTTALDPFTNPNSDLARRQLSDASTEIGNNFNRVVMPGLTSAAGTAGALGGSRDYLARGVAASDAQSQISKAGTDIYSNIWNNASQAAAGKTDAMLSAGTSLPGAALQQYGLGWAPLQQLSGILGGPTVLSQSQAGTQSENWNSSKSTQKSSQFGFNFF